MKFFTWLNNVALFEPKGKRNRENKLNLNEEPYYVYSTIEETLGTGSNEKQKQFLKEKRLMVE